MYRSHRVLSIPKQMRRYTALVRSLTGDPVRIRLLDSGGDKWLKSLGPPPPVRGAALLLQRPGLWRDQAVALARTSRSGPLDVFYPMVVDEVQLLELVACFQEMTRSVPGAQVRHGVMIETLTACDRVTELMQHAAFVCIGTNDLGLACADLHAPQQTLWAHVERCIIAGRQAGRDVVVCGELASRPEGASKLALLGVAAVSVDPGLVTEVRRRHQEHKRVRPVCAAMDGV